MNFFNLKLFMKFVIRSLKNDKGINFIEFDNEKTVRNAITL